VTRYIKAPFPWFGGKSRVAREVWTAFGAVRNYVEPFAGSLAVLLGRPAPWSGTETVNDLDGYVANVWRALAQDPDAVAEWADWPVNETDLHARHIWLVEQREAFTRRLEGDPDYYDAKIAGWWLWGIACWIGGGWCSGLGPWHTEIDDEGHRQLVHLGDAGQGVRRQLVHLRSAGQGVNRNVGLLEWFAELSERLRRVRVCSGDWSRVCGPTPTTTRGLTGVFLDPPYTGAERCEGIYARDSGSVAAEVREWAIAHGDDPMMRIALCGYDSEHTMPDSWQAHRWKAPGGYGNQGNGRGIANANRECIWFSPHCRAAQRQGVLL